jgi:tRNA A-37 threonylcarbamoyl transferase component Bud32/tetratricopeptide (TPR) repeat protein
MLAGGCLDENAVVAFLAGRMPELQRPTIERHLQACHSCAELVTWVAADLAHRSRAPGKEGHAFIGPLAPGSRVDRYQILNTAGRGGMGDVYAAYHPDLDRRVALKVVHESGADSAERRARLLREARAIARLSHPNVVTVYDAGTFDDRVFIAMEFVDGETVDAWLRAQRRTWQEVLDVFIAAGRGLAAAHAAGILHRDFKPQNVMIGRDGAVRVMDFGLARLAEEPAEVAGDRPDPETTLAPTTVTKTGALVGTLAYMAPEQFRRETLDARADQFSFSVALHEALHGVRPALAHLQQTTARGAAGPTRAANVPAWLKTLLSRGLADDREHRFPSMDELVRALARGRGARRRRVIEAGAALGVLLIALGGWRVARGDHINCAAPAGRLAAAWSPHDDSRRQMVHRAFTASGGANAEASWQRVAQMLDEYVGKWSAMYVETCEATHVRGEQSADVLDLRMSCLGENLDEVRALTDVLKQADATAVSRASTVVSSLTPVARCRDLAILRSAIPLPRDPTVLRAVLELKEEVMHIRALADVGNRKGAAVKAESLRPRVESVGYKPLLAQLLEVVALGEFDTDPSEAETVLEQAFLAAQACGDDVTAVRAASNLIYIVGYELARREDAARWARIAYSLLEKLGPSQARLRAWVLANQATVLMQADDYETARKLIEESVRLKVQALGERHWDVTISLTNLSWLLNSIGEPAAALAAANRAVAILDVIGERDDPQVANLLTNRATALTALGRFDDAERDLKDAFRIHPRENNPLGMELGDQLHGYGALRLEQGRTAEAIPMLENALKIRERGNAEAIFTADTRFSLARALWEAGNQRRRALSLAVSARETYAKHKRSRDRTSVETWLADRETSAPESRVTRR